MRKENLHSELTKVERLGSSSKLSRLLFNPQKYFNSIYFRKIIYPKTKKNKPAIAKTFFSSDMHVLLPSATDIYLTGGKSHPVEINLARFLINQLKEGDTFIDVGTHYGYFSLLASQLVGESGKVVSFEASPESFKILSTNACNYNNIHAINKAVSDKTESLTFYEFPSLYSEYNSMNIDQYKNEPWFLVYPPKEVTIQCEALDPFLTTLNSNPTIIKIDVEGAESKVITGLLPFLDDHSPLIILEYMLTEATDSQYKKAETLLIEKNYKPNAINKRGELVSISSAQDYLELQNQDVDNIAYLKEL